MIASVRRVFCLALSVVAASSATAAAAEPKPFGVLDCVAREGTRFCEGTIAKRVTSFDGVPLDVNVTLPASGNGPWPLILNFHGFGGQKRGFDDGPRSHEGPKRLAQRGYVVVNPTSRGFHGSCGSPESRLADPAGCARGWLHLDDVRYEVRDAQYLAGLLVDEGLAEPRRIGAWADSYGGAPSLMLGMLRDRVMVGALAGEPEDAYVPWRSPKGVPMELRAAAPYQTWSDLPYALAPNGRALDYTVPVRDESSAPLGVIKQVIIAGLYATGQANPGTGQVHGYFAPPGLDPDANISLWLPRFSVGEPYEGDPVIADVVDEFLSHHSPLWLNVDREPAPLFLASGGTDDLFPPIEMLRVRNLIQSRWPNASVAMWLGDFGHQRGSNKPADLEARNELILQWFDFYIRGIGETPFRGVEARTFTCPMSAPSSAPLRASTWAALHPGEVRATFPAAATIGELGGDLSVGLPIDPVVAGNSPCATTASADQGTGVATYRLPAVTAPGYTLMGSPTVIAKLDATGTFPQISGRLWDVAPDGRQTLVSRGTLRPRADGAREPFQLSANAWRFAPGHVPKLELLGNDAPYMRVSNGTFMLEASDVELRLPVAEQPGGAVQAPAPALVPPGAVAAPDLAPAPAKRPRPARRDLRIAARCTPGRRLAVRLIGIDVRHVRSMTLRGRLDRRAPFALTIRRVRGAKRLQVSLRLSGGQRLRLSRRAPRCRTR
jgi:hypothetical protein